MKFENLFNPIKIRGMELSNRVVFPAMGTKMATEEGFVSADFPHITCMRNPALGRERDNQVTVVEMLD